MWATTYRYDLDFECSAQPDMGEHFACIGGCLLQMVRISSVFFVLIYSFVDCNKLC